MTKFTLQFTLKQHTPLLHFQHEQAGATLRPTEVKAKFDQYLWKKAWQDAFDKGSQFLVGYTPDRAKDLRNRYEGAERFRALDYKISFVAQGKQSKPVPERMPLYFGNMTKEGEIKKEKHLVEAQGGVTGNILSADPELIALIEQYLPAFFQAENFGTRQNKGFGSFELTHLSSEKLPLSKPSGYYFEINNPKYEALWEHIDLFYRSLRSGINLKGGGQSDKLYFKSLLFQYAKTQGHQWDKRKIRLDLFGNHPKFQEVKEKRTDPDGTVSYSQGPPMLYRDMLGLSSAQSWLSYKATVTKKATNTEIDRFKSPITFKPFQQPNGWVVYIIPHSIPPEMIGAEFEVEAEGKKTTLLTPDFNLEAYLKFAFGYFNDHDFKDYIGEHFAPREARIIENIYDQLSKIVTP